jgi:hypothetical protein
MNAVERLLAHGEDLLSLFDEMYRERLGSGRDPALPDVPPTLLFWVGGRAIDAMPKPYIRRKHWLSGHWLQAACETAWLEAMRAKVRGLRVEWLPIDGKGSAAGEAVAARAADIFGEHLRKREQLLCREVRQRLLADVVVDVREWEPLAAKVVQLAEDVVEQIRRVGKLSDQIEPLDWQRRGRVRLRRALDLLRPYAVPPALATSRGKPVGTKQQKRRDRKGVGGRPDKYPLKFVREVFAARERDQKHAAKAKRRLPAWAPWLWDYCGDSISIAEMFPPAFKGEPWQARADRFKKAAKKRLKDSGN